MVRESSDKNPRKNAGGPFLAVVFPALIQGVYSLFLAWPLTLCFFSPYRSNEDLMLGFLLGPTAALGFVATWAIYTRQNYKERLSLAFTIFLMVVIAFLALKEALSSTAFLSQHLFLYALSVIISLLPQFAALACLLFFGKRAVRTDVKAPVAAPPAEDKKIEFPLSPSDIVHSRYEIIRGLDSGATGYVYLVKDLNFSGGAVEWVMKEIDPGRIPQYMLVEWMTAKG